MKLQAHSSVFTSYTSDSSPQKQCVLPITNQHEDTLKLREIKHIDFIYFKLNFSICRYNTECGFHWLSYTTTLFLNKPIECGYFIRLFKNKLLCLAVNANHIEAHTMVNNM
jgi:hypothetical protein